MNRIHVILNLVFAIAIAVLAVLIATLGRHKNDAFIGLTPPEILLAQSQTGDAEPVARETSFAPPVADETQIRNEAQQLGMDRGWEHFGKEVIFKTIIPKPTPTPTPTPKPPDPIKNAEVLNGWTLITINPDDQSAMFQDPTQNLIEMKVGGDAYRTNFKSLVVDVNLLKVGDFVDFQATVNTSVDKEPYVIKAQF